MQAILAARCVECHSGFDAPMGLELVSHGTSMSGSWTGPVIVPGDPDNSRLIHRIEGTASPRMPLDGPPWLSETEVETIRAWIAAGAVADTQTDPIRVTERARPAPGEPVLWPDVEPILQKRCIKCHSDNSRLGGPPEGLRLTSLAEVLAGGERLAVLPGNPAMSELFRRIAGFGSPRMPFDGPPWLDAEDIRIVHDWIAQGARDGDEERAAIPVGARVRLRGLMTGANEIDGAGFSVSAGTRVDDRPRLGHPAEMRGVVGPDGRVTATRLRDR